MSDIKKPAQGASPGPGFDAEFEAFLREEDSRLAALYRKLPHPEPDAELDARVRAQARLALRDGTAAAAPSGPVPRSRARRWLPAFGAAATLVLVAGLAWRLVPPQAPLHEAVPTADSVTPTAMPGGKIAPETAPPPAAPAASTPPPAQPPAIAAPVESTSRRVAAKPLKKTEAQTTLATDATASRTAANGAVAASPRTAAPASQAPADAEAAAFPQAAETARAKSAAPAKPVPPPPPAAPPAPAIVERESAQMAAAAPAPPPPPPPAEERAEAKSMLSQDAFAQARGFTIEADSSGPARYRWEIADDVHVAAQARSGVYPPDPPPLAGWVEIVRRMLRDGHRDAAKQALADLRARHPDYAVPGDLRPLE